MREADLDFLVGSWPPGPTDKFIPDDAGDNSRREDGSSWVFMSVTKPG
jgi:hypothetical protein